MQSRSSIGITLYAGLFLLLEAAWAVAGNRPELISQSVHYMDHSLSVNIQWQSPNPVTRVKVLAGHGSKEVPVDEYDNRRNPAGYEGDLSILVPLDSSLTQGDMGYQIQLEDDLYQKSTLYTGLVNIPYVAASGAAGFPTGMGSAPSNAFGMTGTIQVGITPSPSGSVDPFANNGTFPTSATGPPITAPGAVQGTVTMTGSFSNNGMPAASPGSVPTTSASMPVPLNNTPGTWGGTSVPSGSTPGTWSSTPFSSNVTPGTWSGTPVASGSMSVTSTTMPTFTGNGMPGASNGGGNFANGSAPSTFGSSSTPGSFANNGDDGWGKTQLHSGLRPTTQTQSGGSSPDIMGALSQIADHFDSPPSLDDLAVNVLGPENVTFSAKATDDNGLREISFRVYDAVGNKVGELRLVNLGKLWQGTTDPLRTAGNGNFRVVVQAVDTTGNTSKEKWANFTMGAAK